MNIIGIAPVWNTIFNARMLQSIMGGIHVTGLIVQCWSMNDRITGFIPL
jgi:hypothetical protein